MKCKIAVKSTDDDTKKKVEIIYFLSVAFTFSKVYVHELGGFNEVSLICRNYGRNNGEWLDLIYAHYNGADDGKNSCLFLGHWNDGVI